MWCEVELGCRVGPLSTEDLDVPKGSGSRDSKLRSGTTDGCLENAPLAVV